MNRRITVFLFLLLLCGCECFLPAGDPPPGTIVENIPRGIADTVMDYRSAVDFYINELTRETMMHCSGEEIFVDADRATRQVTNFILRKSGEFSGVKPGKRKVNYTRLVSRYIDGKAWKMSLFSADGKELWSRSIIIKRQL